MSGELKGEESIRKAWLDGLKSKKNVDKYIRVVGANMNKEEKRNEKIKEKMRKMLKTVPDMKELGFDYDQGGGWQIFSAIYFLTEHSKHLNYLTWALIGLTAILIGATIADIIVRVT